MISSVSSIFSIPLLNRRPEPVQLWDSDTSVGSSRHLSLRGVQPPLRGNVSKPLTEIRPETCSCKSPGWRTQAWDRPDVHPPVGLIYQQLLAPTSAPPQLNHQKSRRLTSYHLLFFTLCFKNRVSSGVHTLTAPPPFTHKHLPVLSHPPSPPHLPVNLSSGVRYPVFTISPLCLHTLDVMSLLLSPRLVSARWFHTDWLIHLS